MHAQADRHRSYSNSSQDKRGQAIVLKLGSEGVQ